MNQVAKKTQPAAPAITPMDMLARAVESGADLDKLEKLMELERTWKADKAREAFNEAMSAFRGEAVEITKGRQVRYKNNTGGMTEYKHADLFDVVSAAVPALSKHRLSHSWKTHQENGLVRVTCTITHSQGHSESTSLEANPDTSGGKNAIQAVGSTVSYLERYTFLALTGLAAREQDDDGQKAQDVKRISDKQVADLEALIDEYQVDRPKYLAYYKLERLEDMPADWYDAAVQAIYQVAKAKRNKGASE